MNGLNFGFEGPNITGWWVNPKTGDKFKAIDTFFEDNNLLIKTSDGRLLNYNKIQDYVQTQNPDSIKPTLSTQTASSSSTSDLPPEVISELKSDGDNSNNGFDSLMIPDDNIFGHKTNTVEEAPKPTIKDFDIIDRALNNKPTPFTKVDVVWDNFPKREIEMLVDVMNISESEIIEYYIDKISLNLVRDMVAAGLNKYISDQLHPKTKQVSTESSGVMKTKVTEVTPKTKTTTTKKK